jgi:sulfotransferase 6B1
LNLPLSESEVTTLADQILFQKSTTFRKGQIGDWHNHFSEQHKAAFKQVAGEALIQLGYETNYDW